jgi:protein gp37
VSAETSIEWTDTTWNPVRGCSVVSPGCSHCYAMKQAHRFPAYAGLTKLTNGGPVWTGEVRLVPELLDQPLRWRRSRRVFVNSMSDLFHDGVSDWYIDRVFAVMALASRHTFQVLTKRPERMHSYTSGAAERVRDAMRETAHHIEATWSKSELLTCYAAPMAEHDARETWPLRNVHLGVSVEDQARADERIPVLLDTPAAVRFISAEPLLSGLDLRGLIQRRCVAPSHPFPFSCRETSHDLRGIDWVIIGGESGPKARPFQIEWARSILAQCRAAQVPVFLKQLGARPHYVEQHVEKLRGALRPMKLRDRKGGDMSEWPEDLRVREMPQ